MIPFQRGTLMAMLVMLVAAEITHPTTFSPKHIAYRSASGFANPAPDRLELDDLPPIVQPAIGNVDVATVDDRGKSKPFVDGALIQRGAVIRLVGWCADPITRARGTQLLAIIDGTTRIPETGDYSIPRPDVARVLRSSAALWTGYRIDVSTKEMSIGPHRLQIAVASSNDQSIAIFPETIVFTIRVQHR